MRMRRKESDVLWDVERKKHCFFALALEAHDLVGLGSPEDRQGQLEVLLIKVYAKVLQ